MGRYFYILLSIVIVIDVFGHLFPVYFSRDVTAFLPIPILIINYFDKVTRPNIFYILSFVFTYLGITLYNLIGEVNFLLALISYSLGILIYVSVLMKRISFQTRYIFQFIVLVFLVNVYPIYKLFGNIKIDRLLVMFLYVTSILALFYCAVILNKNTKGTKLALYSSICFIMSTCCTATLIFFNKKLVIIKVLAAVLFWLSHAIMSFFVISISKTKNSYK